jgi:hypothetical protein
VHAIEEEEEQEEQESVKKKKMTTRKMDMLDMLETTMTMLGQRPHSRPPG